MQNCSIRFLRDHLTHLWKTSCSLSSSSLQPYNWAKHSVCAKSPYEVPIIFYYLTFWMQAKLSQLKHFHVFPWPSFKARGRWEDATFSKHQEEEVTSMYSSVGTYWRQSTKPKHGYESQTIKKESMAMQVYKNCCQPWSQISNQKRGWSSKPNQLLLNQKTKLIWHHSRQSSNIHHYFIKLLNA